MTDRRQAALLISVGLSVAAMCGWAATYWHLIAERNARLQQADLYEERLAHEATRRELLQSRTDSLEIQVSDLWRWNKEAMGDINRIESENRRRDQWLVEIIQELGGR